MLQFASKPRPWSQTVPAPTEPHSIVRLNATSQSLPETGKTKFTQQQQQQQQQQFMSSENQEDEDHISIIDLDDEIEKKSLPPQKASSQLSSSSSSSSYTSSKRLNSEVEAKKQVEIKKEIVEDEDDDKEKERGEEEEEEDKEEKEEEEEREEGEEEEEEEEEEEGGGGEEELEIEDVDDESKREDEDKAVTITGPKETNQNENENGNKKDNNVYIISNIMHSSLNASTSTWSSSIIDTSVDNDNGAESASVDQSANHEIETKHLNSIENENNNINNPATIISIPVQRVEDDSTRPDNQLTDAPKSKIDMIILPQIHDNSATTPLTPIEQSAENVSKLNNSQKAIVLNPISAAEFVEQNANGQRRKKSGGKLPDPVKIKSKPPAATDNDNDNDKEQKSAKIKKEKKKKRLSPLARGIMVSLFCVLMFFTQDGLIQWTIDVVTGELKDGSLLTQNWADIPIPINICFYLFGIKNSPEFLRGGKPDLEEHGPFCYFVYRKRRILEFKRETLTFMERYLFKFNEPQSISLDTKFETINLPIFVSVLVAKQILQKFYVSFMGTLVYNSIVMTLRASGEQWIEQITARQLLEARKVPLLEAVHRILIPLRSIGIPIPDEFGAEGFTLKNHSFGLTTTISTGELGPFEVFSKAENGHLTGDIVAFRSQRTFPGLPEPCNVMRGGDGMFFKRPVVQDSLTVFLQPMCGLLPFVRQYDHTFYGAQVRRYKFDDQWFNMSNEASRCFCTAPNPLEDCDGFHSISPCVAGIIPMGISLPHFHLSPRLRSRVSGLQPDPAIHSAYLDMEPILGAPVNAIIAIQGIVLTEPVPAVPLMARLPKLALPILWMKVFAGAEGVLGVALGVGSNLVRYGRFLWLAFGVFYLFVSLYAAQRHRRLAAAKIGPTDQDQFNQPID